MNAHELAGEGGAEAHVVDAEMAKSCGCLDCLRFLASIEDPEYLDAFREACIDVMGEDPNEW